MRGRHFQRIDGALDDVRYTVEHARWTRRRRGHAHPGTFFGIAMVSLGVLFLLDNLNIIETREFIGTYWPVLPLGWGLAKLTLGRGGERIIGAFATLVGAVLLGNRLFDWTINIIGILWPLVLIGIGVNALSKARWMAASRAATEVPPASAADAVDPEPQPRVDASSTIKEFIVMGGVGRRNVSQAFQGGDVTVVMGGVEIDLRECRMATDEVRVTVFVTMGETAFRIPRDWTVDSRVTAVAAGIDDRSEPPVSGTPVKRFVIDGSAFMGSIEIRN